MATDIFGGIGGLMKGLSSFMPQDDPAVKLMSAQNDVNDLRKQEEELYAEIGRQAALTYGMDTFGDTANKLRLVQANLADAQAKLNTAKAENDAKEKAEKAEKAAGTCTSCGYVNPPATKFCQECGAKLEKAVKIFCTSCGAEIAPGIRFCGECGMRQPE